jgi:hypothetical protein
MKGGKIRQAADEIVDRYIRHDVYFPGKYLEGLKADNKNT